MIRQQAKITNRGNVQNQEEYMQSKRKAQNAEQSAVRFKKYLSKDTIFFLPLYTTTVSLKWNMVRLNCRLSEPFLYVDPHFKGFGWIKFLWSLWLSEVKSPWTSLNAVFPLLGCSARSSAAAYLWAFLHSVLYLITGKHALLDWDHMTQLAIEKNPLLFLEKLLLLL